MMTNQNNHNYDQKIAYARASLWAPFYTVGMAARIRGQAPTGLVEAALRKLQVLYPPLASRVRIEDDGTAWLTTDGVGEFSLEVRPKTSGEDWSNLFLEQEQVPFAFERGPLARFYLLRGAESSDLVAIVPHVVCDGYSMAQVMWEAVALLNHPDRVVARPEPPPVVSWQTMPHAITDNLLLRGLARVVNRAWPAKRVVLRQERYEELNQSYWARQQNGLLAFGLSSAETADLSARCRNHSVSVTGALVAAFYLAQAAVRPDRQTASREIAVAANIRERLIQPPGQALGVYASELDFVMPSKANQSFWELAGEAHTMIHKRLENRPRPLLPLVLEELDPSIADSLVTAVATDQWIPPLELLTRFVKIKGEMRCLNVSNIGRLDLPDVGTPYRMGNLFPFPPLVAGSGLALNVLTINGQMNMILKYRKNQIDLATITEIKERALSYLSGG